MKRSSSESNGRKRKAGVEEREKSSYEGRGEGGGGGGRGEWKRGKSLLMKGGGRGEEEGVAKSVILMYLSVCRLEESGQTALGPALLVSIALASRVPGSKVRVHEQRRCLLLCSPCAGDHMHRWSG